WAIHQADHPLDQVIHVAEAAGLGAVAIDGDGFALERLDDEVADHSAIVGVHARSISVEDTHDLDLQLMLAPVVEEQRLGAALALVVAAANTNRIHSAPITFGLGMDFRIAVDLAGAGLEDARASAFC